MGGGGVTNPLFAAAGTVDKELTGKDELQTGHNVETITFGSGAKFKEDATTLGEKTTQIINNATKIGGDNGGNGLKLTATNTQSKITIQNNSNTDTGWNSAITATDYKGELVIFNGSDSAAAKWTKAVTAGTTDATSKLTINNAHADSVWSGNIDAKGAADITNNGTMSGTITTAGKTSITNDGTISGAITAGGGKGEQGTTINNLSGSITGGIKAGAGDLTIENYAEISGSGKKIETAAGNLTINNHAGDIKAEIDAETAVATSVKITNYAGATISGAVKLQSADQKSATLDNRGKITGAVTATGENVSINNAGIINSTVTVTGTAKKNKHT